MTRSRIIGLAIFLALITLVVLVSWKPETKVEPQKIETTPQPQPLPEKGEYELPPAAPTSETPAMLEEIPAANTQPTEQKRNVRKKTVITPEEEDKGYDSVDPGLAPRSPKLPPPETLKNMQKQGIVIY